MSVDVVVVAARPLRLDDLALDGALGVGDIEFVRALDDVDLKTLNRQGAVVLIDTSWPEGRSFDAIDKVATDAEAARILALTPTPPPHDHVARALRAGALGFVPVTATAEELSEAIQAVAVGRPWLPGEPTRRVLADVADDLDVTTVDRQSKLQNMVLGLIPLAGGLTAVMSLLWRRYLGHIGVRPVDLAVDPTTRIVDAFFALSLVLGVFGPLLFIGSWLDLLRDEVPDRRVSRWLVAHRRTARLVMTAVALAIGIALSALAQVVVALFIGPLVAAALLARAFDIDDELPAPFRITRLRPARTLMGAVATITVLLTVLSAEVLLVGPDLRPDGAHGWFAPSVLGFRAQPMIASSADGGVDGDGDPRQRLYLGGNADLYVLVDPCGADDVVELVSVGSTRLVVIDEITCE